MSDGQTKLSVAEAARLGQRIADIEQEARSHDFDAESCHRAGDFGDAGRAERRAEAAWANVASLRKQLGHSESGSELA